MNFILRDAFGLPAENVKYFIEYLIYKNIIFEFYIKAAIQRNIGITYNIILKFI